MKTKQLARISILAALYVVLAILNPISLLNFKFTFEAFPILIAGLLFGPLEGGLVATLGSLIYQLFFNKYGVTATFPLWMIPHIVSGLIVGLYASKHQYKLTKAQTIFITSLSALTVTALNSIVMYLDASIYHYEVAILPMIPFRILTGIVLAILYSLIIPSLTKIIKKK